MTRKKYCGRVLVTTWPSNVKRREFSILYQPYYLFSEKISLFSTRRKFPAKRYFFAATIARRNFFIFHTISICCESWFISIHLLFRQILLLWQNLTKKVGNIQHVICLIFRHIKWKYFLLGVVGILPGSNKQGGGEGFQRQLVY